MGSASGVRVRGPLAAYAGGFWEELLGCGYAARSAQTHLVLMAQLSRWLDEEGLDAAGLSTARVDGFLCANRAKGHRFPRSLEGMAPLLSYLRGVRAAPPPAVPVLTAGEELLERFRDYLVRERGLAPGTVAGYVHAGALFLDALDDAGHDLRCVTQVEVHGFLLAESGRRSVASVKNLVSGLRSLLRFLYLEGITELSLAGLVPAVAGWSGTSVPRGIDAGSVRSLLASCDRRTGKGRRDFAVLVLLARLGMRAGEAAALELGDVDWRAGEIVVRGKGNRLERLPLPVDVGEAVAGYVRRGRARSEHPQLFLRVLAPHRGLTRGAISVIVHAACDRAGLPSIGTHRLRHTVASELLRRGAGLPEIGQILRHRSIASTSVYAKVDTAALSQLARPWPGGAA